MIDLKDEFANERYIRTFHVDTFIKNKCIDEKFELIFYEMAIVLSILGISSMQENVM